METYSKKLRPIDNQSETIDVHMKMYLLNINNFDELTGELGLCVAFNISWKDEKLTWKSKSKNNTKSLLFEPGDIWHPNIFIRESYSRTQTVTNISAWIRVFEDGSVFWTLGAVISVTCSVDVTYFPFDTQTCTMTFTTMDFNVDELALHANLPVDTTYMTKNSQWVLEDASLTETKLFDAAPSSLVLQLNLKRKAEFFVVYIIVPIVFLGALNNLVFLMPYNSGERNSVAITTFLSFVVYLPIINDSMPKSSAPIAYVYYYVMFLLIYSSLTMFLCIISMRIYDKTGKVPDVLQFYINLLKFKWLTEKLRQRRGARKHSNVIQVRSFGEDVNPMSDTRTTDRENSATETIKTEVFESEKEITWIDAGKIFDLYAMITNMIVYWIYTIVTFSCLYANIGLAETIT
ncbi:extracellular ligand-gated ion channel [Mactra antiquata]